MHGGHSSQAIGTHGNERRDMHGGGSTTGGMNPVDQTGYSGHSAQGDRGGGAQGGISGSGGPGGHSHSAKITPAPEFEMKGNDFPALPGAGESIPRKASESSEGVTAWGESNR